MENKGVFSKSNWFVLLLFGMLGQVAWSVENMYFNLFVFKTISADLGAITLMVQLSGITATVVTLIAGTLSDKLGNRRRFISIGYIIWGITVALFGLISADLVSALFNTGAVRSVAIALTLAIVGDCVMTLFGSCANDAAFNAWVTDNTDEKNRGKIEGVLSILPLIAMLIVAGGFGILTSFIDYKTLFIVLGALISVCGIIGIFKIKDSPLLVARGSMKDIFYGFSPKVVKENKPFYASLLIILIYGIASQIFMPYMIIYMTDYLHFNEIEYSIVFGLAIALGAAINVFLTRLSDKLNKIKLIYIAASVMAMGLLLMYIARAENHIVTLALFGIAGFIMISGYIFVSALVGSTLRDYTPEGAVGKLQGVRMVASVLIPMIVGPFIGNSINKMRNIPIQDASSPDAMTTLYVPAPEIFLVAGICTLLVLAVTPILSSSIRKIKDKTE